MHEAEVKLLQNRNDLNPRAKTIMSLNQISLRAEYNHDLERSFNIETWSIAELYFSFLRSYDTRKVQKCTIRVSDNWGDNEYHYTNWLDSKGINLPFDFEKYFSLDRSGRKRMQLEAIHAGMMEIAAREGWAVDPLLDAYNACLAKGLQYRFEAGKPKSSPDRRYKIGFWCDWDIDVFEVYWVLYDKSGKEIRREKLLEKPPYEGEFMYYAKWKWLDNNTVLLEDKSKYGNSESWKIELGNVTSIT